MLVTFGFLRSSATYRATIPDELDRANEAYSVAVYGDYARSIQWADANSGAALATTAGLHSQTVSRLAGGAVETLHQIDPDSKNIIGRVLKFTPQPVPARWGHLWVVFDPTESQAEIDMVQRSLHPSMDAHGITRVRLAAPLSLGDLRDPVQRDSIAYYTSNPQGNVWSARFTLAEGFAADSNVVDGQTAIISVASSAAPEIVVTCDGPSDGVASLQTTAQSIAGAITRV